MLALPVQDGQANTLIQSDAFIGLTQFRSLQSAKAALTK